MYLYFFCTGYGQPRELANTVLIVSAHFRSICIGAIGRYRPVRRHAAAATIDLNPNTIAITLNANFFTTFAQTTRLSQPNILQTTSSFGAGSKLPVSIAGDSGRCVNDDYLGYN